MRIKYITRLALVFLFLSSYGSLAAPVNNLVSVNKLGALSSFSFETNATDPLIEYHYVSHMIANSDTQPMLQIYGDGRVLVHFPIYMKNAGDYEMQISQQELVTLIESFTVNGLLEFDSNMVNAKKNNFDNVKRGQGDFYHISDNVTTQINVNLKSYQTLNKLQNNFKKKIKIKNIEHDAKRYMPIQEIQKLGNSVDSLRSYLTHIELKRR